METTWDTLRNELAGAGASRPASGKGRGPLPLVLGVACDPGDPAAPDSGRLERVCSVLEFLLAAYPATPACLLFPPGPGPADVAAGICARFGAQPLPFPDGLTAAPGAKDGVAVVLADDFSSVRQLADLVLFLPRDGGSLACAQVDELPPYAGGDPAGQAGCALDINNAINPPTACLCRDSPWPVFTPPEFDREEEQGTLLPVIFSNLEMFNRDALRALDRRAAEVAGSRGQLALPAPDDPGALGPVRDFFALFDALSLRAQRCIKNTRLATISLAVPSILFMQLYSLDRQPAWALGYSACIAGGLSVFALSRRLRWHAKYHDYRSLAELLRIQAYWAVAGVAQRAGDHFPLNGDCEILWIRKAAQRITARLAVPRPDPGEAGLSFAVQAWVKDQERYFNGSGKDTPGSTRKAFRMQKRLSAWTAGVFFLGIFLLVLQFTLPFLFPGVGRIGEMGVLSSLLLAVAAGLETYSKLSLFSENAKRYRRSGRNFQVCRGILEGLLKKKAHGEARDTLFSLGRESLFENSYWLMLCRQIGRASCRERV